MSWTDERVEKLKQMWTEGKSASAIAKELGGVTRNAVIGKVHRLGLSNRAGAAPAKAAPKEHAKDAARPTATERPRAAEAAPETKRNQPDAGATKGPEAETGTPAPETAASAGTGGAVARRPVMTPGQPLPPQPSANEISPEALATVREVEKKALKLSLMELTERTCKWPIGDPATEEFWFCGLPAQAGKPYCEAHVGVAFQPMSSRRDRRRS